jgi:peptide/nickel transport system substrate-binding protein
VATYRAILDPASASEVRSSFSMIDRVDAVDPLSVRFTLRHPYAAFPTKLLIGIVPSESVATPGAATESPLNTAPIGTGPYRLTALEPTRAVFEANENYWGGAPSVKRLTVLYVPDDNTRAQRMAAGELDGTSLPPLLAATFEQPMSVRANTSPDWRGVSMPAGDPVAGDPAVRLALNYAVDRQAMIDNVLGGYGRPAYTPFAEVYGESHNPAVSFAFDRARAEQILEAARWRAGADGVRVKDGVRARFTVMYNSTDTLRRDLALAFASDARRVGVEVDLEALSWDRIEPRIAQAGILLGGGSEPYDPDTQAYNTLHSPLLDPSAGSPYDNASRHADPAIDARLDTARRSVDPAVRAAAYREVQSRYAQDPSHVFLVHLDHTYVVKDSSWTMSGPILEPHAHGVTWGPWWSLQTWTR